jgi:pimeloyl-ACP methyl ester carboxylesterase
MIPLEDAIEMYQMIPNAELAVLPNTHHLSVVTNPEMLIHIVLDFLMRQGKVE